MRKLREPVSDTESFVLQLLHLGRLRRVEQRGGLLGVGDVPLWRGRNRDTNRPVLLVVWVRISQPVAQPVLHGLLQLGRLQRLGGHLIVFGTTARV
jgi:hypothetical protein